MRCPEHTEQLLQRPYSTGLVQLQNEGGEEERTQSLFGSDPGKAAWARQRLQASDFARLRLDGPAWRSQILQGTNQTSPQSVSRWDKQEEGSAGREEEEDEPEVGRRNPRRKSEREGGREGA